MVSSPLFSLKLLRALTARDAMTAPIVSVDPDDDLLTVAEAMGARRVRAVLVTDVIHGRVRRSIVSDLDVVRAAVLADAPACARQIAATEALQVEADDDLVEVALALADHDCSHAIVVEDGHPVGMVSSLDLAAAL